jgi:hypothetical protein
MLGDFLAAAKPAKGKAASPAERSDSERDRAAGRAAGRRNRSHSPVRRPPASEERAETRKLLGKVAAAAATNKPQRPPTPIPSAQPQRGELAFDLDAAATFRRPENRVPRGARTSPARAPPAPGPAAPAQA